jgi:hypothetical protein
MVLSETLSVPLFSSTQALRPSPKPTAVSLEFCASFLIVVQSPRQRCQRNETSTVLSRGQKRHLITFAETCTEPSLAKKTVERSVAIYRQARVLRDIPTARRLECLVEEIFVVERVSQDALTPLKLGLCHFSRFAS